MIQERLNPEFGTGPHECPLARRSGAVLVAGLASVLLTGVLAACSEPPPPPEVVRVVRTMQVATQAENNVMELAADIRARTEIQLAFRVGGKLVARNVEVGQLVRPGEVLAQLDPSDLRSGLAAASARVQAAAVQRTQARADLKRFRRLRKQGFISDAELDGREATYKAANAQFRQALAQKQLQANQASYAQLTAEAEGIVVAVDAEVGAVLSAGVPVVRIARNGQRDAVFAVPENQRDWVMNVKEQGIAVPVSLWGSDNPVSSQVREVAAAADSASRTYLVRATLNATHLAPGQTATVRLPLPGKRGAFVPMVAVFERAGKAHVWLVQGNPLAVKAVPITVEPAGKDKLLVTEGLPVGATVVTAGVHVLQDGQPVRLASARAQ